jgi:hypothetical protein
MENGRKQIVILGSGIAGIAAAIAASQAGARVVVVDKHEFPGGQATHVNVGTFCGLVNPFAQNELLPHPFLQEFVKQYMEYDSSAQWITHANHKVLTYDWYTLRKFTIHLFQQNGIDFRGNLEVVKVGLDTTQSAIDYIEVNDTQHLLHKISADAWVDASGGAVLNRLGGGQLITDDTYQSPALVFELSGIPTETEFQLAMSLNRMAQRNNFPQIHPVPGSLRNGNVVCKLAIPASVTDHTRAQELYDRYSLLLCNEIQEAVKKMFPESELTTIFPELGVRTSPRGFGKNCLTSEQVLSGHLTSDSIALGSWPVENWMENGQVHMTPIPDLYAIPIGCVCSADWNNVYFAGKTISADATAIASARVMGTCLQTGFAAGLLSVLDNEEQVVHEIGIAHVRVN